MPETALIIGITFVALNLAGFPLRTLLLRWRVPPAISLMALGLVVGPAVWDLLPEAWLARSAVLSKAAFVVLLLRAGLGLPLAALRRILVPALIFGIVPVTAEFLAVVGLSQQLGLFANATNSYLAGFLVAAVSPAVVLPVMLHQKDLGRGATRLAPDRIIGQTVVNAFVAQTGILVVLQVLAPTGATSASRALFLLPLGLAAGLLVGTTVGWVLPVDRILGKRSEPSQGRVAAATTAALAAALAVYFGCAFLSLESVFATLALGVMLRRGVGPFEPILRVALKRVWLVAEVILFANLGSRIDIEKLAAGGIVPLLLLIVAAALLARLVAAGFLARKTDLTLGEQRYVVAAHIPKATIQAVFGALPLITFIERGQTHLIADGHTLLILAVICIVATAPLGAVLLDRWGERSLEATGPAAPVRVARA